MILPAETRACLRDGRKVRVRPIRSDDAERLAEFHQRLSLNTVRLRFFSPMRRLSPKFARHLANVDFKRRCAFVISFPGEEAIRAVGRYEAESSRSAELALVVEDALQGLGVGVILLDRLVEHARSHGYERFTAAVLYENSHMLNLLRDSPYHPDIHVHGHTAFAKLDIRTPAPTPA